MPMNNSERKQFIRQYKEIHQPLMRFCMVKANGIMDPEDLFNDTLLAGLENYHKIKKKEALLAWMFTTANRICLNQLRRKKFQGNYHPDMAFSIPDHSNSSETRTDISFLYEAINQLPELQKEAIILFEISDLPIKEIMEIQQAKSSTVKQRLKRGREKLAALLNEKKHQKKIALLTGLLIGGNSFSMSQMDQLFQHIKEMPLPVSESQALKTIATFQGTGAAVQANASKAGMVMVKKMALGTLIAGGITTAVWLTTNTSGATPTAEDNNWTSSSSIDTINLEPKNLTTFEDPSHPPNEASHEPSKMIQVSIPTAINKIESPASLTESLELTALPLPKKAAPNNTLVMNGDTYPLASVETVKFDNFGDHLVFKTWSKDQVQIIENHTVEGQTEEDTEIIRRHMQTKMKKEGGILTFSQGGCIAKHNIRSNRFSTITFNDGEKARYKKMEWRYTVMIPNTMNLEIDGHYQTVSIPDVAANLNIHLFEGQLDLGDVSGETQLKLHYAEAKVGSLTDATIYMMEGKLTADAIQTHDFTAKYSTVKTNSWHQNGGGLLLFESHLSGQKITGNIAKGSIKYGSLKFDQSDLSNIQLNVFESRLELPKIGHATLNMRYSKLISASIQSVVLPVAFESSFDIQQIGSIQASSSKYSNYSVGEVMDAIDMHSFEDKIDIEHLHEKVQTIELTGKYSTYAIKLSSPANYRLAYDGKYGQLDYSAFDLEVTSFENKNDHKVIEGFLMGGNDSSPLIRIKCFESKVHLN